MQVLKETDTAHERLKRDVSFTVEGVSFYVDAPDEGSYENDNNYSLITCVTNGETRFLLMGDAKKIRTKEFLSSAAAKEQYDLIKMPHHGNYTKNLETLFETAKPRYAVLTADPERLRVEEETVSLLNEYKCEVYYTDEGVVTAVSDGKSIKVGQTDVKTE